MTRSTRKPGRQRQWEQQLFPDSVHAPEDIWRNILNANSLRLTVGAHKKLLQNKDIKFYHFKIQEMTNLQLLQLDHLLTSPYYIRSRHAIELMGEQDAMMLSLHGNNLKQYLENLNNS